MGEETWRFDQLYNSFHLEVDSEAASLADTIWVCLYIAVVGINNLLDNGEAEAETLAIHLCCSLQFAEAREDLTDIFLINSRPSVLNANT